MRNDDQLSPFCGQPDGSELTHQKGITTKRLASCFLLGVNCFCAGVVSLVVA